jgi:hypothetical protein
MPKSQIYEIMSFFEPSVKVFFWKTKLSNFKIIASNDSFLEYQFNCMTYIERLERISRRSQKVNEEKISQHIIRFIVFFISICDFYDLCIF